VHSWSNELSFSRRSASKSTRVHTREDKRSKGKSARRLPVGAAARTLQLQAHFTILAASP
jgi:hypothetical protein